MIDRDEILVIERGFWLGGADHYRERLTDDFLMAFSGVGMMDREAAIAGIESGSRWSDLVISGERFVALGETACLLAYTARARRDGEEYRALVSSAYRLDSGAWKLAFHQQSPLG
jgi:hypothetical protein